jgi:hypothetical protein
MNPAVPKRAAGLNRPLLRVRKRRFVTSAGDSENFFHCKNGKKNHSKMANTGGFDRQFRHWKFANNYI